MSSATRLEDKPKKGSCLSKTEDFASMPSWVLEFIIGWKQLEYDHHWYKYIYIGTINDNFQKEHYAQKTKLSEIKAFTGLPNLHGIHNHSTCMFEIYGTLMEWE